MELACIADHGELDELKKQEELDLAKELDFIERAK